jgi:hypothetical protein
MGKDLTGKELGKGISQIKSGDYTARFTDITIFKNNKVILENYYTDEKYSIEDKKFAEKISFYLYSDEKNGIFHWYEMGNEIEKWMNNRKFSKIYDNLENRK